VKARAAILPSFLNASSVNKHMPEERILEVHAQEDFVEKLTAAQPAQALAELIWNGLDAEATRVAVEVDRGRFG
jgi:DNA mismatch repair ATPase MutL